MKQRATVICCQDRQWLYVRKSKADWTLPGGRIEPGETPAEAGWRELQEETGITARDLRYLMRYHDGDCLHHVFQARLEEREHPVPANEIADCRWRRVDRQSSVKPRIRRLIASVTAHYPDLPVDR
ncbi:MULTISPECIES: NUDIX hydrolase [Pseudomonas]|uniref:NUDIX hydrolase n=1 Tax=Pseudomonas piscis TaxID=2614538 RepID=A0ABY9NR21_9PSED|nr:MULTISPECIES: NUDIX hydrolase [Pseudomonas]WMN20714.1 NUDIX hydrolase [Pseudomonas piscis]